MPARERGRESEATEEQDRQTQTDSLFWSEEGDESERNERRRKGRERVEVGRTRGKYSDECFKKEASHWLKGSRGTERLLSWTVCG